MTFLAGYIAGLVCGLIVGVGAAWLYVHLRDRPSRDGYFTGYEYRGDEDDGQ